MTVHRTSPVAAGEQPPWSCPSHLFWLCQDASGLRDRLDALASCSPPPRVVLLASESERSAEELVRTSGLPWTIACPGPVVRPGDGPARRLGQLLASGLSGLVRALTLGARGHAVRPIDLDELAFGLAQTGLGFSTTGRTVQGQELRRTSASARGYDEPLSRRDGPRF